MSATELGAAAGGQHSGRILYLQYTNPAAYPPLEHSAHILADAGNDVRMLGTSILGDALELKAHPRIRVVLRPFQGQGWRQKLAYASFACWTAGQALRWRPTWIYASDPLACPIALMARRLCQARLIYHEHDSPDDGAGRQASSAFMRAVLRARRAVARQADVCVLPNAHRAEVFGRRAGRTDVLTVWNCPMREDVGPERTGETADRLRVLYHGSIVPSRLPSTVIDALARLPSGVSLQIGGYETAGHSGYAGWLLARAETLGIGDRVRYLGTVPRRSDLMQQCSSHDVGLALLPMDSDDPNERAMFGASNKPFDYLANGLAVLVADLPAWREAFVETGYGLSCDASSAESIATALRWFLEHPGARVAMGEHGRRRIIDEWNYETAFAPVLREIMASARAVSGAAAMTGARV